MPQSLFRRHVGDRAQGPSAGGVSRVSRRFGIGRECLPGQAANFRQAEIENLGGASIGDKNVGRFDIAVQNPFFMRRFHTCENVRSHLQELWERQRAFFGNDLAQVLTFEEFHDEERASIFLPDIVQSANVRMIER